MKHFEFNVTVLGGGSLGSSILFELQRHGLNNIGLVDEGNGKSATLNSGGMLRVFHERTEHVELALTNHKRLKKILEAGVLTEPMVAPGSLYFFNKGRYESIQSGLEMMSRADYPFEVLTPICGRKRFPQFNWGDDEWAVYEPLGSQLSPARYCEDLLYAAESGGATVLRGFEVLRISRHRDHFRLSGTQRTVTTKQLILAGGARLLPRLSDLRLSLPLESRLLTAYEAEKSLDLTLPNFFDRESLEFACLGRNKHVTLSRLHCPRLLMKFWREPLTQREAEDCYAPERMGLSGEVAGFPGLCVATGWGGTGFKFSLAIANRVAGVVERASHGEGRWMNAAF